MAITERGISHLPLGRRSFLGLAGAAAGTIALAACGSSGSTASPGKASNSAGIATNLGVMHSGYDNPTYSVHMSDVVAWEKGYLKDAGFTSFDDKIIQDSLAGIIGGGVDWTRNDTDDVFTAVLSKKQPIIWLGTLHDQEDQIFGLAKGVTIESLKEHGGTVTGGVAGSRNEMLAKEMLTSLGVDVDHDVHFISADGGADTYLASILAGHLDGALLQVRSIVPLEQGGGTIVYNKRHKVPQDGFTVNTSFFAKNQSAVTAYLYGLVKAKQFIKDDSNKDEIIAMLAKHNFVLTDLEKQQYDRQITTLSPDGGFEVSQMETFVQECAAAKEFDANIDWRSTVNLEPLWTAQVAAGLPKRPASL